MAPFKIAPSFGGVFWAEKEHDQFRLLAVKLWEINIQIWAREFGFVLFVIKHPILAEGVGKVTHYLFHKGAMLTRNERAMAKRRGPDGSLGMIFSSRATA